MSTPNIVDISYLTVVNSESLHVLQYTTDRARVRQAQPAENLIYYVGFLTSRFLNTSAIPH